MSNGLTRDKIEIARDYLKACEESLGAESVDALCDLAIIGLDHAAALAEAEAQLTASQAECARMRQVLEVIAAQGEGEPIHSKQASIAAFAQAAIQALSEPRP
jgi:hypothetical protein